MAFTINARKSTVIPGTKFMCQWNCKTVADTHTKSDDQKV